eukprot:2151703-Prymnesium_polylepis.1
MALSGLGYAAVATISLFVLMLIGGQIVGGDASPNGEVGFMIEIDGCRNRNMSFTVNNGQSYWYSYPQRADVAGELPGTACPLDPAPAGVVNVSMEEDDGYRKGASYAPVFFLTSGSWAKVAMEVVDSQGTL